MNGNDFLDKMELIDPAYVEAADKVPKKKRAAWLKWGAVAACLCVAAAIVIAVVPQRGEPQPSEAIHLGTTALSESERESDAPTEPKTEKPSERETEATTERNSDTVSLEKITIPDLYAGFGFEGFAVYDISEYRRGNPWSPDMDLTTLPVYRNGAYDPSRAGVPRGFTEEEMKEQLERYADAFGLTILSTETKWENVYVKLHDPRTERKAVWVEAQTDGGVLRAVASGSASYTPTRERARLPEGYRFTYSSTTDEEAMKTLAYLTELYADVLGLVQPVAVTCGDYDYYGKFDRIYFIYDGAGTAEEVILNYNFCRVGFASDEYGDAKDDSEKSEAGSLRYLSQSNTLLLAEKLGDYPIISAEEAKELLLSGCGQSSVPPDYPAPTAETVEHVELIYRIGALEEVLLPYYRFDVRLPDKSNCGAELGLKSYGVYYVPAIAAEYITNMPTYTGWFNS